MQTLPRFSHTHHRRAFGPHQSRSPETKARHVAESILLHEAEGHAWRLADFGLQVDTPQWTLVLNTLAKLRAAQANHAA